MTTTDDHLTASWKACSNELQALAERWSERERCPSIAWGLVLNGELAHFGSVGTIGPDGGEQHPPTADSVYRIASMSKSFTAAALLRARDAGLLRLDDPLAVHEPAYASVRAPHRDAPAVTLRHLVTMSSGLTTDDAWADRHLDATDDDLDRWVFGGLRFGDVTGTTFEYSNLGFALLGRALHRATGRRVQDLVVDDLMQPLGMFRSGYHMPANDDWARPYEWIDDGYCSTGEPLGDGVIAPMGGIWSTVADLAKWVAWLDDAFPARDDMEGGPLCRSSRREMQQVHRYGFRETSDSTGEGVDHVPERNNTFSYAMGLNVIDDARTGLQVTHTGGLPGYGSNMRWLPGRRVGLVALANSTYAPMRLLTRRMMEVLVDHGIGAAPTHPVTADLRSAGDSLVDLVNSDAVREPVGLFADNADLDQPIARRLETLRRRGPITGSTVEAETDHRGMLVLTYEDGSTLRVRLELSPLAERRIQMADPE